MITITSQRVEAPMLPKVLLAAIFWSCLPASLPAATIILVRHAERSSAMSADALLSPVGTERAQLLARMLKDSGVQRIYVTEVRRTQQTAEPIAATLHLTPVVIAQSDTEALISQLRGLGENETVLVVGHTNTIPLIAERLGAGPVAAMPDSEYDRLTVLYVLPGGKAHAVTLRYGNATE
jgi:broad specificity phosphatase PhoE